MRSYLPAAAEDGVRAIHAHGVGAIARTFVTVISRVLRCGRTTGRFAEARVPAGPVPSHVAPLAQQLRAVTPDAAAAIRHRKLPVFSESEAHHRNFTLQRLVAPTRRVVAAKGVGRSRPKSRRRSCMTNGRNDLARVMQKGGECNDSRLDSLPVVLTCGRGGFTFGPRDDTAHDLIVEFGLAGESHKSIIRVLDRL